MDRLYRFSPITTKEEFERVLLYIAEQSQKMIQQVCGQALPIESLRVFAHYPNEYRDLTEFIATYGPPSTVQPQKGMYVDAAFTAGDSVTKRIGIRPPDPHSMQVGHADFAVDGFEAFRQQYSNHPDGFVRELPGREESMLEIWHPDFDVLGYVVRKIA